MSIKRFCGKFVQINRVQGVPPRGRQLYTSLSKCSRPFIQSVKSTLSHLKSCNPVGGTPSGTAWAKRKLRSFFRFLLRNGSWPFRLLRRVDLRCSHHRSLAPGPIACRATLLLLNRPPPDFRSLSVNSPALIMSKNSGVSLAKNG